jgi:hypothetical protein
MKAQRLSRSATSKRLAQFIPLPIFTRKSRCYCNLRMAWLFDPARRFLRISRRHHHHPSPPAARITWQLSIDCHPSLCTKRPSVRTRHRGSTDHSEPASAITERYSRRYRIMRKDGDATISLRQRACCPNRFWTRNLMSVQLPRNSGTRPTGSLELSDGNSE